jgi:spore germination protein KA
MTQMLKSKLQRVNMMKNDNFLKKIQELSETSLGISIRKLSVATIDIYILNIAEICDKDSISNNIIKPLLQYNKNEPLTIETIANSIIYVNSISMGSDENLIIDNILKGKAIILIPEEEQYVIADTLQASKREIQTPELEGTLRGPKDCFTENFESNLSLIRYRIKDPELRLDKLVIGKRTKTSVAVIYINNIANPQYVNEIMKRLQSINIDGIIDSGYIQKFLKNSTFDLFPQLGIIERSDLACISILEGKICIVTEGSNLILSAPKVFIDFFNSSEDAFDSIYFGMFNKFIRIVALMISLASSALYVAIVGFHSDILPVSYIMILASSRGAVPFNAVLEASLLEFVSEILREASVRLPKRIGSAIGIVGTIVIGQAAVSAGLVSPLMVIIVSLSTMCSFVAADFTIMNPIRIFKFLLIFMTAFLGLFGFIIGITFILVNLLSTSSFGVPYGAPVSPLNLKDLKGYLQSDALLSKKRPRFLKTKNKNKQ